MVRKRCQTCGKTSRVKPREVRCKQIGQGAMGPTGYLCYGRLERAISEKPKETEDKLSRKLADAHIQFEGALRRMKRTMTSVAMWQRRIKSIERSIEFRDHPELKPKPMPKKRTRAITLPDEEGAIT